MDSTDQTAPPMARRVPLGAEEEPIVADEVQLFYQPLARLHTGDTILDRYEIDGELGSGGMGVVYRARQSALGGRFVAVKHINAAAFNPDDVRAALERLRQEGLILAQLRHTNLVQIYDCLEHQDDVYLVMEYVEGETLQSYVERAAAPVTFDSLVGFASQLADVLGYLHAHTPSILFRDLKPTNIMIDRLGKLRLIDFGVARCFGDSAAIDREEGTPGFASPEQLRVISVTPDVRSDVYSLGATLYFLVTGKVPTDARRRVSDELVTPITRLRHDLPIRLQAVLKKALKLNPEDRYQSVHEFQDALINLQFEVNSRDTKRLLPYPSLLAPGPGEEETPPAPALTISTTAIIRPADVAAQRGVQRMKTLIVSAAHTLAGFGGRKAQPVLSSPDMVTAYIQDWRGRNEPLTLVAYKDELLTFVSRRDTLKFPIKVRFYLPGQARALERLVTQAFRIPETWPERYCVPMSETPYDLRQALTTMFAVKVAESNRRSRPRLRTKFQVTSEELWGHRGIGIDVNLTGACIHSPLSVSPGVVLPVRLHLDDDGPVPVDVRAEVRWCETQPQGGSLLGLHFVDPSRDAVESLELYERQMTAPAPIRL